VAGRGPRYTLRDSGRGYGRPGTSAAVSASLAKSGTFAAPGHLPHVSVVARSPRTALQMRIAPLCKDISLQRGRFCAGSLAACIPRSSEEVIMNVLHPGCARPRRWSPPVLWRRFEDSLASICVLIHSCKMPKKVRRRDLMMDKTGGWLIGNATDVGISDKVIPLNVQDFS